MIFGYVGTPGSGKTYEAVRLIINNLKLGKVIYTNIEGLEQRRCRELIKNVCGLTDYSIERQLKIFEPDQLEDFWNHVEPQSIIVLDEVQKIFPSREWQSDKNKHFGFWASTHRHNGFEVVLITQNPERIDSAVRSLFEWTYLFRKVNYFGGAVQKKYICYCYDADDTQGKPLVKKVHTYDPIIFKCYKSYVTDDIKEQNIRNHVNVLKHPIFFAIPIVLCLTLYLVFGKSSLATGDLFGTGKIMDNHKKVTPVSAEKRSNKINTESYSTSISMLTQDNGVVKYSNRFTTNRKTTK